MNSTQELELLDEVLYVLNDMTLERADSILDAATRNVAKRLKIAVSDDDVRVVVALAYEQIAACES